MSGHLLGTALDDRRLGWGRFFYGAWLGSRSLHRIGELKPREAGIVAGWLRWYLRVVGNRCLRQLGHEDLYLLDDVLRVVSDNLALEITFGSWTVRGEERRFSFVSVSVMAVLSIATGMESDFLSFVGYRGGSPVIPGSDEDSASK